MKLLPTLLIVGVVVTVAQSPSIVGDVRDAAAQAFTPHAATAAADQKTYDRLCPLLDVWADLDTQGRHATTKTIKALARQQTQVTEDPATAAFLRVIPAALNTAPTARAARALINRECRAHDN